MLASVIDNSTSTLIFWCVHLCSFLWTVWMFHRALVYTHKTPETFLRVQKSYKTWKRILVMSEYWLQGPEHARRHSASYKSSVITEKCVWKITIKGFKIDFLAGGKCKTMCKNSDLLVNSSGHCTLSECLAAHNPAMSSFVLFFVVVVVFFRIAKVPCWAWPGFIHLFCYPKKWASEYIMWIECKKWIKIV